MHYLWLGDRWRRIFGGTPSNNDSAYFREAGDEARDAQRWRKATKHYSKYLEQNPSDAAIWVQLGNSSKEARRYKRALDAYDAAIALDDSAADTHLQKGHLLKAMGRPHDAIESYLQSFELQPEANPALSELLALDAGPAIGTIKQESGVTVQAHERIQREADQLTIKTLDAFIDYCVSTDGNISKIVGDALLWQELDGIAVSVGERSAATIAAEILINLPNLNIVDFGCGARDYRDYFEGLGLTWIGLDVRNSRDPKATPVTNVDETSVAYYDGIEIPLPSNQTGAVFSNQTFEHVNDIDGSMREIERILAPGGYLFGSVSQTEPYHSVSTFNWTPYGIKLAFERNGLKVLSLRAGIDSISLMARYLANAFGANSALDLLDQSMFTDGRRPLWNKVHEVAKAGGQSEREAAIVCLGLAGQVQFIARKEGR